MALEKKKNVMKKTGKEEEEEDEDEKKKKKKKKKSESKCLASFEEMLQRFAYNKPPTTPKPRAWPSTRSRRVLSPSPFSNQKDNQKPHYSYSDSGLGVVVPIHPIPNPKEQSYPNSNQSFERVVSPYFQKKEEFDENVDFPPLAPPKEEDEHNNKDKKKNKKKKKKKKRVVSPYFNHTKENDVKKIDTVVSVVISPCFLNEDDERKNKKNNSIKEKENDPSLEQRVISPYFFAKEELEDKTKKRRKKKDISNSSDHRVVSPYFLKDQKIVKKKRSRSRTTDDDDAKPINQTKKTRTRKSVVLTAAERMKDAYRRRDDSNTWIPPRSTHGLLQEYHHHDPWRVLVICILLNVTSGTQVKQVIDNFFEEYPDASAASEADPDAMKEIIKSLGLKNKRTEIIRRMSKGYLEDNWTHVTQLYGIGKYAADAYAIFCNGKWNEVTPQDHKLEDYWAFMNRVADSLK